MACCTGYWCFAAVISMLLAVVTALPHGNLGLNVEVRQNQMSCSNDNDCYPDEYRNQSISIQLIECLNSGQCFCAQCFSQASDGRCAIENACYYYNNVTVTCVDNRRSQVIAFILTMLLSSTGAANFYIGRYDLAVPQLLLLIFTIVFPCCLVCIPLCIACCGDSEWGLLLICPLVCGILLMVAASIAMFAWWIADAVIFGTNQRLAGNGCALENNL